MESLMDSVTWIRGVRLCFPLGGDCALLAQHAQNSPQAGLRFPEVGTQSNRFPVGFGGRSKIVFSYLEQT